LSLILLDKHPRSCYYETPYDRTVGKISKRPKIPDLKIGEYCGSSVRHEDIGLVASNYSNLSFGGTRYFIPPGQSMGQSVVVFG
jgi:hypothetical protein